MIEVSSILNPSRTDYWGWNFSQIVPNMRHITPNSKKDGIAQTSLVVALQKIKGPTHMVEGGHNLWNSPPPNPNSLSVEQL